MPDGTKWDESSFYNYGTRVFGNYMYTYACSAFAGSLSDYIFGKDAPATAHQNFDDIKIGDVIWLKEGSWEHAVFVTDVQPTTSDSFVYADDNSGGYVRWNGCGYSNSWSVTQRTETYVYSRY